MRRLPGVDDDARSTRSRMARSSWASARRFGRGAARAVRARRSCCRTRGSRRWSRSSPASRGRTGFVGEARYGVLNDARRLDEAALPRMVDRFCLLAEPRGDCAGPRRRVADASRPTPMRSRRRWRGCGLDPPAAVALCVGAEYGPAKRWPAAHFAALAQRLAAEGRGAWLLGGPGDAPIGDEVAALAPARRSISPAAPTSAEAIDLIAAAAAVVSNDSGLMHVAAALGRPMSASTASPRPTFTPPLSDRGGDPQPGPAVQPLLQARLPARPLQLPERPVAGARLAALQPRLGVGGLTASRGACGGPWPAL